MSVTAYPLSWPAGWKRTPAGNRKRANFSIKGRNAEGRVGWPQKLTVSQATTRLLAALRRMGAPDYNVIISTNVQVRLDGLPYSNQKEPQDPGVAIYWKRKGKEQSMATDQYNRVADNLAALAATIDYIRGIERHGGAEILERAFLGFQRLPPPISAAPWWEVLEFQTDQVTRENVEQRYKDLAKKYHPDAGGYAGKFAALSEAIRQAREVL